MIRFRRAALLLPLLIACGCAALGTGDSTREKALIPLRASWPGVSSDVERGIQDGIDDGDLPAEGASDLRNAAQAIEATLRANDLEAVQESTIRWASLRPWGDRGIDDRIDDQEIAEGAGKSLTERLNQFDAAITALQGE